MNFGKKLQDSFFIEHLCMAASKFYQKLSVFQARNLF